MGAIVIKEIRELLRDRRTIAMLILIPVVLLIVFGYAANFTVDRSPVLISGPGAKALQTKLEGNTAAKEELIITAKDEAIGEEGIHSRLQNQEVAAVISILDPDDEVILAQRTHLYVDGSALFNAQAVQKAWMRVLAEDLRTRLQAVRADIEQVKAEAESYRATIETKREQVESLHSALDGPPSLEVLPQLKTLADLSDLPDLPDLPALPDTSILDEGDLDIRDISTVLFNPDLTTAWIMVPGLIGVIMAFIGIVVTAIGLVRERETGTLEQLAVMPLHPAAIIFGKITPYFVLSLVDAALITWLGVVLFKVPFAGSLALYALFGFVFMFVVLGFGILISSLSQTTGQAIQLSIMTVMPQIMLSGLIFPLELMAPTVRWIGYGLPLTWFIIASRGIMLRDAQLSQLNLPLAVLVGMAVVVFSLAIARMHHLLRKGGAQR